MKYFARLLLLGFSTTLLLAQNSTPQLMKMQGSLTDNIGTPVTGTQTMTFVLYDASVGGVLLGTIGPQPVVVSNGLYEVDLTFGANLFSGSARYIEITINGEVLSPRVQLVSTPFSYSAEKLDGFEGAEFLKKAGDTMTGNLQVSGTIYSTTGGFKFPDGTSMTTAATPSVGNTLGQAYNQGGPGAGSEITTVAGAAVEILGPGGLHVDDGGKVGIGTSSPGNTLDVYGGAAFQGNHLYLRNQSSPAGHQTWGFVVNSATGFVGFGRATDVPPTGGSLLASVIVVEPSAPANTLRLEDTGHAVIKALEITGGADIAEPFDVVGSKRLLPGTVVAIDATVPGKLVMSDRPYDTRVAGIVSGAGGINPGITLQQQEGGVNVAMAGRVYVLADASLGPIRPGDLLTTSSLAGHAMKAKSWRRAQGAVIGKAMSSLDEGTGLVLVLVNLQ